MKKESVNPMVYAAIYLGKKSASEKVSFGNGIVISMTANPNFTDPNPTLISVQTAIDELAAAVSLEETTKSVTAKADLVAKESNFDMLITTLKEYVEITANIAAAGDTIAAANIISSSGFPVAKTKGKAAVPSPVSQITAQFTNIPATVDVVWKSVKNARSYIVEVSTSGDPGSDWQVSAIVVARKATITGLTANTRYYFRVTAVGVNGNSAPGTIATCIAS